MRSSRMVRLGAPTATVALTALLMTTSAAGSPGVPVQQLVTGTDVSGYAAIDGPVSIAPAFHGGLALADAAGAQTLGEDGDLLRSAGSDALGFSVDANGTSYASFSGDSAVHTYAADGTPGRTYDLTGNVQPSLLVADLTAPDWYGEPVLYAATAAGIDVIDLGSTSTEPDGFILGVINATATAAVVEPDHSLLTIDAGSAEIQHWSDQGIYLGSFTVTGGDGGLVHPTGIALSGDGTVLLADGPNNRVVEASSDGDYIGMFGMANPNAGAASSTRTAGALDDPQSLAVDCAGRLWVLDVDSGEGRLVRFGGVAHPAGSCGSEPSLSAATHASQMGELAVDRADDVFVSVYGEVQKFSAAGKLASTWGSTTPKRPDQGGTAASFGAPGQMAVGSNGDLWVPSYQWEQSTPGGFTIVSADPRVLRFHSTGALVDSLTAPVGGGTAFVSPTAVAVRPADGHVFVADGGPSSGTPAPSVQELDPTGHFVRALALQSLGGLPNRRVFPLALAFEPGGDLLVSAEQISAIDTDDQDNVYVEEAGGVERFDPHGQYIDTLPVPVDGLTDDTPYRLAVRPDGSMIWSEDPYLPVAGNASADQLLVTDKDGMPLHPVAVTTFGGSGLIDLAVDCVGRVYAGDDATSSYTVLRYSTKRCVWAPTAITGKVASKTRSTRTVSATVNPASQVTQWRVRYGTTSSLRHATAWRTLSPSDNTRHVVTARLPWRKGHALRYAVQARNASATVNGKSVTTR